MGNAGHRNLGPFTMLAGEDLAKFRLVKRSSSEAVYADAGDIATGITTEAKLDTEYVAVYPLQGVVQKVVCSKAIADGDALYTANDGKVSDAANGDQIGEAWQAGSADGSVIAALMFGLSATNTFSGVSRGTIRESNEFTEGAIEDGGLFSETADQADWLLTIIDGAADGAEVANVVDGAAGGILVMTTNDADGDGLNAQKNGEAYMLAVGKPLSFAISMSIEDVSEALVFVGLAITDTAILTGGVSDRVGFEIAVDGTITAVCEKDSTQTGTDTTGAFVDGTLATFATTKQELSFQWDGVDTVNFFIDGVFKVAIATANIPTDEHMTPSLCVQETANDAAAAALTAWFDYYDIQATR